MLKAGFEQENATASITILQPYHGPHPPSPGTPGRPDYIHVFGQFAFKQPTPNGRFRPDQYNRKTRRVVQWVRQRLSQFRPRDWIRMNWFVPPGVRRKITTRSSPNTSLARR